MPTLIKHARRVYANSTPVDLNLWWSAFRFCKTGWHSLCECSQGS